MKQNSVAINFVVGKELINKNGIPIMFYWDGEEDIFDALKNNEDLISWMKSQKLFEDNYTTSKIALFYFTEDENGEEKINTYHSPIQDLWNMELINEKELGTNDFIIADMFDHLYIKTFNNSYGLRKRLLDFPESISNVYDMIKARYGERVSKETIIQACRAFIQNQGEHCWNKLSQENLDYVINEIRNNYLSTKE